MAGRACRRGTKPKADVLDMRDGEGQFISIWDVIDDNKCIG